MQVIDENYEKEPQLRGSNYIKRGKESLIY